MTTPDDSKDQDMNLTPATDAPARYLGQLLTSPDHSAEWRVGREFVLLDQVGREQLVHDIIAVYGAGDPEYQVAARLRDLTDSAMTEESKP